MSSFAALVFGVVAAAAGHVLLRRFFLGRSLAGLAAAGGTLLAGQIGYYIALRGLDIGSVYMANGFIPVIAIALSTWLLDERIAPRQIGAVASSWRAPWSTTCRSGPQTVTHSFERARTIMLMRVISERLRSSGSVERLGVFFLVATAALVAFQLVTLTRYPVIHPDEPWFSNATWNWLTTGINFDTMHAGVLDQFGYEWVRRSFLGELPWLLSFHAFGLGFFQARLVSWLLGAVVLTAVWRIGNSLYGRPTGALAAFLLCASPAFVQASHETRQEILLVLVGLAVFALARRALDRDAAWLHLAVGVLAGTSTEIHQNGVLYIIGLVALYGVHHGRALFAQRGTWLCAAGGVVGICVFVTIHVLPSPETYMKLNSFVLENSHGPPLFEGPGAILRGFVYELLRYKFNVDGLPLVVIASSFAVLIWRREPSDRQLLAYTGGNPARPLVARRKQQPALSHPELSVPAPRRRPGLRAAAARDPRAVGPRPRRRSSCRRSSPCSPPTIPRCSSTRRRRRTATTTTTTRCPPAWCAWSPTAKPG